MSLKLIDRSTVLRTAFPIVLMLLLACNRPTGDDVPQLRSPILLEQPTEAPEPTPEPTATPEPTPEPTPLTATATPEPSPTPEIAIETPTPQAPETTVTPDVDEADLTPAPNLTATAEAPGGDAGVVIALDALTGVGGLDSRTLPTGPPETRWEVETGNWFLTPDGASEDSLIDQDLRAVLLLSERPALVSADINLSSGLAGLVMRYTDDTKWVMVWFNDDINNLAAGTLAGNVFTQLLSAPYAWDKQIGARRITIEDDGDRLTVLIDGESAAEIDVPNEFDGTGVGIFNRDSTSNLFRNFAARAAVTP